MDVRDAPVLDLFAPVRTRDLEHVPRHQRRADEWGVVLTSGVGEVTVNKIAVVELCDCVRGEERRRNGRVLELMDQAFRESRKDRSSRRDCASDATTEDD